jgi:hypothetical protein
VFHSLAAEMHARDKDLVGKQSIARSAFVLLFERPWFCRLWILQEVVLAKELEILCGSRILSWDQLVRATVVLESYDEDGELPLTPGRSTFPLYSTPRESYQSGKNMEYLAYCCAQLDCSNARSLETGYMLWKESEKRPRKCCCPKITLCP